MTFIETNNINVYKVISPMLFVSKLAAVCSVTRRGKTEMQLSKVLYSFQIFVMILCILHLGYIPYAVIYIEQVSI